MSNIYSPEAQKSIDSAENKLGDAIQSLKSQPKNDEPHVEVIHESTPDVDVVIDSPAPQKEPRRSEFVKTDDPKVIERINDLYGQVKKSDSRNQMILEHNRIMEEKLAEYQDKLTKFERNTQDTAISKIESDLKAALRVAREENDFDAMDSIEDKLLDLRVEKRLFDKIPQQEKVPQKQTNPQQQQFETQLAHNAHYIENLANERNEQGNLARPYLYDWHPDNQKAVEMFTSIPKEFEAAGKRVDMKTMMQVLDERIQGKKPKQQSSVLGGDNNEAPSKTTVRLTQAEMNTARNMGISPERYARQKQLLNS